jgi:hypothetical protein
MEEGIKQELEPLAAEASSTGQAGRRNTVVGGMADATFKSIADVLKLLPTATVILYGVLNPIVTNTGDCHLGNKVATAVLLPLLAFFCAFSTFTDSYAGADGKVKYGLVTPRGMLPFSDNDGAESRGRDFSGYRLRLADFVHAAFAVAVFAAVALLADANTVKCFYPALLEQQQKVVMALPVAVGALASVIFAVFPSTRHGVGYPAPPKPETASQ